MEARIARLESDVAHLRTDVADIKVDLRGLRQQVDLVAARFFEKIEKQNEKLAGLESSIASAKISMLLLLIGYGTAILGAMARGFGWI